VHGAKGLEAPIVILADSHYMSQDKKTITLLGDGHAALPVWTAKKIMRVGPVEDAHAIAQAADLQENWRLFYVAITRARDRLYFAGWEPHRTSPAKTWYQLAGDTLDTLETVTDEDGISSGARHFRLHGTAAPATAQPFVATVPVILPTWATTAAPHEPTPPRPLTPSQLGGEDLLAADPPTDTQAAARSRGTALHKLLELLPQIAPEGRASAASTLLTHAGIGAAAQPQMLAEVTAILTDPGFASVFAPQSLAEVPITALLGETVLSGQIDRLAVTDTQVLIVDYKTNTKPPQSVDAVPPAYLRQMAAYRLALRQIYPHHEIVAALLWTATPALMPLPDALLDAAAASFAGR
jgi:ATP-dependent helicase/nuclease subunit A